MLPPGLPVYRDSQKVTTVPPGAHRGRGSMLLRGGGRVMPSSSSIVASLMSCISSQTPSPSNANRLTPGTASARPGRKKFSFRLSRSASDHNLKDTANGRPISSARDGDLKRTDS